MLKGLAWARDFYRRLSFVARDAIPRCLSLHVAAYAPAHRLVNHRPYRGRAQVAHVAVAGRAFDLCDGHVPAMRKKDVVRLTINPLPWNQSGRRELLEFRKFGLALELLGRHPRNDRMAIHAVVDLRHASENLVVRRAVAGDTSDTVFPGNVPVMVESNRLHDRRCSRRALHRPYRKAAEQHETDNNPQAEFQFA